MTVIRGRSAQFNLLVLRSDSQRVWPTCRTFSAMWIQHRSHRRSTVVAVECQNVVSSQVIVKEGPSTPNGRPPEALGPPFRQVVLFFIITFQKAPSHLIDRYRPHAPCGSAVSIVTHRTDHLNNINHNTSHRKHIRHSTKPQRVNGYPSQPTSIFGSTESEVKESFQSISSVNRQTDKPSKK